jgi:hypothetical protein
MGSTLRKIHSCGFLGFKGKINTSSRNAGPREGMEAFPAYQIHPQLLRMCRQKAKSGIRLRGENFHLETGQL